MNCKIVSLTIHLYTKLSLIFIHIINNLKLEINICNIYHFSLHDGWSNILTNIRIL